MKPHRFPFGREPAPPLSAQRSTIPMDPAPEQVREPSAMTATAPLSVSRVSRVRAYATEPLPPGLRRPVLPFRAGTHDPLKEEDQVPARHAVAPLETVEQEQELSPEARPKVIKTSNWPLAFAVACVVAMLLVTAVQVVVELRSLSPVGSVSVPPLPTVRLADPTPSSVPLIDASSAVPAQSSAPPAASLAPVLPHAPVPRKRPPSRGDIIDPWGSEP
jgi:hypothetical protein